MDTTAAEFSIPAIVDTDCLVLSHDKELFLQLQGLLQEHYGCQVRELRQETLQQFPAPQGITLFVDARTPLDEESARLVDHLATAGLHLNLSITMSTHKSAPDLGCVRLPRSAHLRLPIEPKQLDHLLCHDTELSLAVGGSVAVEPYVVQFNDFRYSTYSQQLFRTLTNLHAIAKHDVTILLVGETGTGKTTLARLVHELSPRSDRALLTVPCGALPGELIESELFGHVKGSFTGADRSKIGRFEAVGRGTLLLDEIDVLGPQQQAGLLRVIETGEFEPVGSNETHYCQARLIVASNVDLNELMKRNEFRSDLYYRLSMLEFDIIPLRERPQDIVPLALRFIRELAENHKIVIKRVSPEFLACVARYQWLGNVRELKNHIRRAVLFCQNEELTLNDLTPAVRLAGMRSNDVRGQADTLVERMASNEQQILLEALKSNAYSRTHTAEALGISRVGLYKKMKRYGLLDRKRSEVSFDESDDRSVE